MPAAPDWISGFALAAGVDVLVHDAQYSAAEYVDHVGWGHSALTHTLALATAAGVRRLVTFHHDPGHDDDTLTRLLDEACAGAAFPFEIVPGTEGLSFNVGNVGNVGGAGDPGSLGDLGGPGAPRRLARPAGCRPGSGAGRESRARADDAEREDLLPPHHAGPHRRIVAASRSRYARCAATASRSSGVGPSVSMVGRVVWIR